MEEEEGSGPEDLSHHWVTVGSHFHQEEGREVGGCSPRPLRKDIRVDVIVMSHTTQVNELFYV